MNRVYEGIPGGRDEERVKQQVRAGLTLRQQT
jgi:hypothetical protein